MRFSWDNAIPTAVSRCGSVCPIKVYVYSYSSVVQFSSLYSQSKNKSCVQANTHARLSQYMYMQVPAVPLLVA